MIKTQQNTYKNFAVRLPILSLNITIMASLLLIFVFLGATSFLYLQSTSTNIYRQALEEVFRPEYAGQERKRLYKYHENQTMVIYEAGQAPYFYDKQADKFARVYPFNGTGPVHHPAKDNEHYVTLMLDQESALK